ncbi:MAG: hypothetical protein AAF433_08385 [Bacteroidota bacterium]
MDAYIELSDEEFESAFVDCRLPPALFNHEADLRLAWLQLRKYDLKRALANIQAQLLVYVSHLGAQDKYHQTLTVVAVHAVHHFMQQTERGDFQAFLAAHPLLKTDFKELVNSHYSFDIFSCEEARIRYLEPDLMPF